MVIYQNIVSHILKTLLKKSEHENSSYEFKSRKI